MTAPRRGVIIGPVAADDPAGRRLVCFALAGQSFGAPIEAVKEAVPLRPITPVFLVPPFVRGIMNLRGDVVAVLDLLRLLGLEAPEISDHSRVVIVRHGARTTGLLADELRGVMGVDPAAVQPPPATLPAGVAVYLQGVVSGRDPLMVLDLGAIFDAEPLAPYQSRG